MRSSFLDRDYDSCLVAHIDNLPYQEGIPLTSNHEESYTEIATSSSGSYYPDREILVITQNNNPGTSQNRTPKRLAQVDNISEDESTIDNETPEQRNQRRARNATRAERRQSMATNIPITNLERAFNAIQAQEHNTSLAAIASINLLTTLMPQDKDNAATAQLEQRGNGLIAQLAEQAYKLLDKESPIPSVPRITSHQDGSRGAADKNVAPRNDDAVNQPRQHSQGPSKHKAPTQQKDVGEVSCTNSVKSIRPTRKIREMSNFSDLREILNSRREREVDSYNHFPAFTNRVMKIKLSEKFKPTGITKYDGK